MVESLDFEVIEIDKNNIYIEIDLIDQNITILF